MYGSGSAGEVLGTAVAFEDNDLSPNQRAARMALGLSHLAVATRVVLRSMSVEAEGLQYRAE
jgi:hypothetical protein